MNREQESAITPMQPGDWPAVRRIYAEGIATGDATFRTEPPDSWESWSADKIADCSLVLRRRGEVCGWATLLPVSSSCYYSGVAELSLYIGAAERGRGLGSQLLAAMIEHSEARGIWTLQAGIFPENAVSLALHRKHGFRVVGIREKIGRMAAGPHRGLWRDVVLMERRSLKVGID